MAIVFKKKAPDTGITASEENQELTKRQLDALEAVGLSPQGKVTIKKKLGGLHMGDKVVFTNPLFPWIATHKVGDTGVVMKSWMPPASSYARIPKDTLYEIQLDNPRMEVKPTVLACLWELDKVQTQDGN